MESNEDLTSRKEIMAEMEQKWLKMELNLVYLSFFS